jgi:hypothetical protein
MPTATASLIEATHQRAGLGTADGWRCSLLS